MKPNLTQSRRGAEKERRGNGRLDRERHSTVIAAEPHDFIVGLARRCRPNPQARTSRLQCQERKKEFAVASGEPEKQDSGQQAANSSTSLPNAAKQAKKHPMRAIPLPPPLVASYGPQRLRRPVAVFATPPHRISLAIQTTEKSGDNVSRFPNPGA